MLASKTRWIEKQWNKENAEILAKTLSLSPILADLLVSRGITTSEEATKFLNIDENDWHDPFLLHDMDRTVERIKVAIEEGQKILVFGDYDADGVSSTTVLIRALREVGANASFYIPNRFTEGYGPNNEAFQWAKNEGYDLIITVDTGISALREASFAKDLKIDLIITDHHEPGPELPDAYAIIHPKKPGSSYPFEELAGVGVALKVAHALLGKCPDEYVGFAAIGTIADLVPLHDENRLIASKGIQALRNSVNPGLKALLNVCGISQKDITEETIGFSIGPRINAAGRLDSADPAVDLFLTEDENVAMEIANTINALNKERQKIVNEMTEEAIKMVDEQYPLEENPVLIIGKEGWNAGVIGIVASRLVEKFYRPTIVLSLDSEKQEAKGSARSIEGFDLFENLSTCRDILPHFGGHTMAAGMTISYQYIEELRERLIRLAGECLTPEDYTPITKIDVECELEDISIDTIEQLQSLSPFGVGNPKPKFAISEASIQQMKKIGQDQSHLKLMLEKSGVLLDGIAFGHGHVTQHISPLSSISVIGDLSINEWNNHRKPQIMIEDICVKEWQLFDFRGNKMVKKQIESILQDFHKIMIFNEDSIKELHLQDLEESIWLIRDEKDIDTFLSTPDYVVFADMPPSLSLIEAIVKKLNPKRIYAFFNQSETHFFNTIPTREHFKWFYAFLAKNKEFDMKSSAERLAKQRGWSKESIQFMSKVFFELEFVTINNGIISLTNQPKKRDLTDSRTYQQKQEQIEIEDVLMYSSYSQLKDWFDHVYKGLVTV
ncbi:single-stranded-DNA-specific exonuclease RecJ [Bacillus salitolerans]|uniref:Single-stranded-DNA-specific exonuclease RecJ n=1 Tax=Bacillus salitolerans TaxID=1437434 RepID=A0ABW4LME8_9BACI